MNVIISIMTIIKLRKVLLAAGITLFAIQLPWFVVVQTLVNRSQIKTTATVIRIERNDAGCTGDKFRRIDPTCDHSYRLFPVYEYYDNSGKRYEQDDRFLGEYKENNPLRSIFGKNVGDKTTAYYSKDKSQEVLFMSGPFSYAAWLIPIFIALPALVLFIVISVYIRLKR